jgi:hypothetical protein
MIDDSEVLDYNSNKVRRPVIDEKSVQILISELEKAKAPVVLI